MDACRYGSVQHQRYWNLIHRRIISTWKNGERCNQENFQNRSTRYEARDTEKKIGEMPQLLVVTRLHWIYRRSFEGEESWEGTWGERKERSSKKLVPTVYLSVRHTDRDLDRHLRRLT
jgi:hypothetical protein